MISTMLSNEWANGNRTCCLKGDQNPKQNKIKKLQENT